MLRFSIVVFLLVLFSLSPAFAQSSVLANAALARGVQLMQVHRFFVGGGRAVGLDAKRHQRDVE